MSSKKYTFPRPASAADSIQPKQRKPMPRPADAPDAEWRAGVQRREAVRTDRRSRLDAKKIKYVEVAAEAADQEEVSRAGMMNSPGRNSQAAWRRLQGVALATHSSTMLPWGYAHSPGYSNGDAHGGFNPNTTFPHGVPQHSSPTSFGHDPRIPSSAFSTGLNIQYSYSAPTYSSATSPRHGRDHHERLRRCRVAAASHPEFGAQDETIETISNIDDQLDNDDEGEGEDEAVEAEPEPLPKKGRKRKRAANAKPAEPRVKWTSKEDECLAEAWKTVSINPTTDTNQNSDTYWGRIKTAFDERKLVDPDFANIHMDRGEKAMSNRRSTIQTACNKWHGIVEEVDALPESGAIVEDRYGQSSPALVRCVAVYFADMFCPRFV
ncbi:putative methionyl-tRNA synthetase [Hordeum vulgare]|nr:putative methionyl-tRNA synthetase [Hordeum vulgare]